MESFVVSYSSTSGARPQSRVGLLEDSNEEAVALERLLKANLMQVCRCARGDQFLSLLLRDSFDVLVLDWTLPDMTGYDVLRAVRIDLRCTTPILMLTARSDELAVVQALNGGADDYLAKPWRPLELLARLRVLKRGARVNDASVPQEIVEGWMFDESQHTVAFDGKLIKLPHKQFEVARLLFEHLGRPVSREHLNQRVWNGGAHSRTVDAHVSKVRTQLRLMASSGLQLQSIYGFGYRLDAVGDVE